MAISFFYVYVMATSFFYIYTMATSFFYIYIDIYTDIYIDIFIDIYKLTEGPVVLLNAIFLFFSARFPYFGNLRPIIYYRLIKWIYLLAV